MPGGKDVPRMIWRFVRGGLPEGPVEGSFRILVNRIASACLRTPIGAARTRQIRSVYLLVRAFRSAPSATAGDDPNHRHSESPGAEGAGWPRPRGFNLPRLSRLVPGFPPACRRPRGRRAQWVDPQRGSNRRPGGLTRPRWRDPGRLCGAVVDGVDPPRRHGGVDGVSAPATRPLPGSPQRRWVPTAPSGRPVCHALPAVRDRLTDRAEADRRRRRGQRCRVRASRQAGCRRAPARSPRAGRRSRRPR